MEDRIRELTLLMLFLTSKNDSGYFYNNNESLKVSSKSYSFNVLDCLTEKGFLYPTKNKCKYVIMSQKGVQYAEELVKKYLS